MRKYKYKVRSVIFDMDGVITNTMPDHYKAWKKIMSVEGVQVSHYDIYSREGQRGLTSVKELFIKYDKPFSKKKALEILDKKEQYFKKIVKVRFIIGARKFIRNLNRNKMMLALVTGTSRHELMKILPENIRSMFSVIITGCEVKNGKPHPEPFLSALKKMNIMANEAVVIENAPFGIESAKSAGLKCLALETSLSRNYLKQADAVFSSIKEMEMRVEFKPLQNDGN